MRRPLVAAAFLGLFLASFEASGLPPGFTRTQVASGLSRPTAMAFAPDGRLFVTERGTGSGGTGRVRVIKDGVLLSQPVLSVTTDNTSVGANERGLLGIALDPGFQTNGFIYVYYTVRSPVHNRVSRFTVTGDRADPASELRLLDLEPLSAGNHNGGALLFGRDGKLYVAVGENARASNSTSLNNHLGKILRINKDGTVPTDNPFFEAGGGDTARDRIWAYGLRNPYSMAVHPASGRIFVNDVGQSSWEEINDLTRGRNYGWTGGSSDGDATAYFRYPASLGKCIAGGAFYAAASPPGNFSRFVDHYFYGDYQAGWVRAIHTQTKAVTVFDTGLRGPIDVEVAADGSVYIATHQGGEIFRVTSSGGGGGPGKQDIVVNGAAVDLREGTSSGTATVELAAAPAANVTVTVAKASGDRSITVAPASLTFTPSNWNRPQALQVTAAQDPDTTTDSAVITVSATGVTARRVSVNAIDDDSPLVVVITGPRPGDVVSGAVADFYGGPDDVGVKGEFFIDGALAYTDQGPGHYHFGGAHGGWDTTGLAEGRHTLRLVVTDAAGRTGSHQLTATVRNTVAFIDPDDPGDTEGDGVAELPRDTACGGGDPGVAAGSVLLLGLAWRRRRRGR